MALVRGAINVSPDGSPKCAPYGADGCFTFRADPSSAKALRSAGFTIMNIANNHAMDYGPDVDFVDCFTPDATLASPVRAAVQSIDQDLPLFVALASKSTLLASPGKDYVVEGLKRAGKQPTRDSLRKALDGLGR